LGDLQGEIFKRRFSMMEKKIFIEKNSMLVREFDKYILEHPEFADKIPNNGLVVMQVEGDEEFNNWAKETALSVAEKDTPIVYITITELKPVRSRIEKLKLELVA
jgi:hypothetical protein